MTTTKVVEEAELERLRKRLDRERRVRSEAEAISEKATRELYDKQQELRLLQKIAVAANRATSVEEALQTAVDEICAHCGWPVGHVYLPAADGTRELFPTTIWHLENPARFETFRRVTEATRLAVGIGLPGRVLLSGRPAWIIDVNDDPNFPRAKLAKQLGVRAGFGFPVLVGAEVVAVLEFFCDEVAEPDEPRLEIMAYVGTQLGRVVERKQAEDALKQRAAQLEAANKELEGFSYSVSHDLRAPLRAADGFSRILLEEYAPQLPPEAQRYLQLVRSSSQQMGQLVDDLLAFSRLGRHALRKQTIAPVDLVRHCLEDLRTEQEGRRVEITVGKLPTCQVDPGLLKQVFVNLLANALKFTRRREVAVIEVGCREDGGERVFFVRDNGVGFDMQYADKLFGVFQRLHRAEEYEGTGVGLAIVQRIIHRHGGRVWAEAELDKGTTFYFTLEEGVHHA